MLHCIPLIFRLAVTFLLESDESQIISYSPFKGYLLATWYCYAGDVQRMSRKNFSGCLVGVDSARRWSPLGLSRLVVVIFFFLGVIFFLGGHLLGEAASSVSLGVPPSGGFRLAPPAAAPLLTAGEVSSCLAAAVGSWLLFRQLVVLVLGSGVAVAAGGVGCLAAGSSSRLLAIS